MDLTKVDWTALEKAIDAALAARGPSLSRTVGEGALRADIHRLLAEGAAGRWYRSDLDAALVRESMDRIRAALLEQWATQPQSIPAASLIETLRLLERAALPPEPGENVASMPDGYEFSAGVAHDLRSPLTSILFLAETLLTGQSGDINEAQRRQLGIIYSAALGLVTVASDIIELVRGGDGLTEREPLPFSVTEILESVRDIVRPMAEERGLAVHLFPPADDLRFGFPLALSRVLLNLTTNALKFTDNGFVEIAVRAVAPGRLEFSVRDTGRGYSPEALETLYEPFRQTRPGKHFGFSGSGLGLAISRKLVRALGSTLEVETRPKWGTRFYFEIELPTEAPQAAQAASQSAAAAGSEPVVGASR